uniref:Uncharacterized protein n=1 Tax=Dunaliella tertiolecta TaxID=3047 RepID=A0A7S3R0G3_DUNTE|eukprot:scaffold76060_cov43-Tisochrysis_lutea.AAC.1
MRKGKRSSVVVSRLYTMHTPHQGRDKHIQSGAASHTAPTTHDLYNVDSMEGQRQHCDCRSRGELVSAAGKGAWLPTTLHARHKQAALPMLTTGTAVAGSTACKERAGTTAGADPLAEGIKAACSGGQTQHSPTEGKQAEGRTSACHMNPGIGNSWHLKASSHSHHTAWGENGHSCVQHLPHREQPLTGR